MLTASRNYRLAFAGSNSGLKYQRMHKGTPGVILLGHSVGVAYEIKAHGKNGER